MRTALTINIMFCIFYIVVVQVIWRTRYLFIQVLFIYNSINKTCAIISIFVFNLPAMKLPLVNYILNLIWKLTHKIYSEIQTEFVHLVILTSISEPKKNIYSSSTSWMKSLGFVPMTVINQNIANILNLYCSCLIWNICIFYIDNK